jgi:hypothetical protein
MLAIEHHEPANPGAGKRPRTDKENPLALSTSITLDGAEGPRSQERPAWLNMHLQHEANPRCLLQRLHRCTRISLEPSKLFVPRDIRRWTWLQTGAPII